MPILILWTCTLVPDWTGLKKPEGFPSELAQVLEVGTNGVWKMPFYTPVTEWLIQRRKQSNKRLKDTPVYENFETVEQEQKSEPEAAVFADDKDF